MALLRPNRTKKLLAEGGVAFGSLSLLPEPAIAETLGATGYDFLVIDTEHVSAADHEVEGMVRACEAVGITPLVRARGVDEGQILRCLDAGAQGVVVPLVDSRATADAVVSMARFPPLGRRTLCSATRSAGHGAYRTDLTGYLDHVNRETLVVALIETPDGVARAQDIVESEIDVFFVGRADLSLSMGLGYQPNHPDVVEASRRVLGAALDAGKVAAIIAYDLEQAAHWLDFGCTFIIYSQPEMVLTEYYRAGRAALDALPRARTGAGIGG
jgi:2-keto-3-deoxy-L-rhamnonate aldolase RhmA